MARSAVATKIATSDDVKPAAAAGKPMRKLVIAGMVRGKAAAKPAPTPEQIALSRQTLRIEVADLDERVKVAFAAPIAEAIAEASPAQVAQLAALKAQRDKRKAIEMQLAAEQAREAEIAAPLKDWMREHGKTQIRAVGIGRYCLEQRAAGVTLREASASFTLRS